MVVGPWRGGAVSRDDVSMFQPESLAIIKKDLLARPDISCCKDADPVMSGFRTDIGLIARGESRVGCECRSFGVVNVTTLEVAWILGIQV